MNNERRYVMDLKAAQYNAPEKFMVGNLHMKEGPYTCYLDDNHHAHEKVAEVRMNV
jgi:hypothetical protein